MHVLVDLDGTLIDPKPGLIGSIQYALQQPGAHRCRRPKSCLWLIGPPLRGHSPSCSAAPI